MFEIHRRFTLLFSLTLIGFVTITACKKDEVEDTTGTTHDDCTITLYDGDNFEDDKVTLDGPAEYPDLSDLPGTDKNWDDEADSFKASENAIAIFWSQPNFQGDSTVFKAGAEEMSVDEPRSLKIRCE